jgi:predicted ArsR family transcriptional regulator
VSVAYIDLLKATRAGIVNLLKRRGGLTASLLAEELGISTVAVRRHLEQLEAHGLVRHTNEHSERGRPRHVFSLTVEGNGLFPDRSSAFARGLLEQVERSFGCAGVDRLLGDQSDGLIEALKAETAGLSLDERVQALARRFDEMGYVTEVIRLEDGSSRILEHNCPTREIAERFPQLCSEELRVYREVAGAQVYRECRITAGGSVCAYRIVPFDAAVGGRPLPVLQPGTQGAYGV